MAAKSNRHFECMYVDQWCVVTYTERQPPPPPPLPKPCRSAKTKSSDFLMTPDTNKQMGTHMNVS